MVENTQVNNGESVSEDSVLEGSATSHTTGTPDVERVGSSDSTETGKEPGPSSVIVDEEWVRHEIQKGISSAVEELRETIEREKVKIIETLGIFVALFTFVSVDIQIFRSPLRLLSAAGFTLIMLGALLLFLLYSHAFLNNFIKFRKFRKVEAPIWTSLRHIAASVSVTTEEIKISWRPKTWSTGVWLQVIYGATIFIGIFCIGIDYRYYEPIYFDSCGTNFDNRSEGGGYLLKRCLERQDSFEKEYVRNERFDTLRRVVSGELVKKVDISHLERLYKCLKERKYWQYEQCFIE